MRDSLDIEEVACGVKAAHWKVDKWLDFVLSSRFYKQFYCFTEGDEAELIIRGDGFKSGNQHRTFLLATLGNFGLLSKCVLFNFVINLCETNNNTHALFMKCITVRNITTIVKAKSPCMKM